MREVAVRAATRLHVRAAQKTAVPGDEVSLGGERGKLVSFDDVGASASVRVALPTSRG